LLALYTIKKRISISTSAISECNSGFEHCLSKVQVLFMYSNMVSQQQQVFKSTHPKPTNLWFQIHGLECLEWQEVCSGGRNTALNTSNEIAGVLDAFHLIKDVSSTNKQDVKFLTCTFSQC